MDEKGVPPAAETEQEPTSPGHEKPSKDLLDKTWDFFASVPVATVLLFLTAAASVVGSLIEQEGMYSSWKPPIEYYPERYGEFFGMLLYKTGLTRAYTSWWFLTLLFMVGISLVICSLERFIPLWKAVQRPNIAPDPSFVKHLKNRFTYLHHQAENPLARLAESLKARRYHVIQKGDRLYADKGRWGRWGPYITHIGLIFILLGALMRAIPGVYFEEFIWVRDGGTVKVPNTDWYITSEKFVAEFYEDGAPKNYETHAVVIEDGKEVKRHVIRMNEPLQYKWVELYQSSYRQELGKAQVQVLDRVSGEEIGSFTVDLIQPRESYQVGDYTVRIEEYFPDFGLDENGKPVTRSSTVQNPGMVLQIEAPDGKTYKQWYFVLYPEMEFDPTVPVRLHTADYDIASTTGLKVKKDLGVPVIYFGLLITSIGVCLTFYIAHRRYWALVDGDRVVVGGWTNRNQSGLRTEMKRLATELDPQTNPPDDDMEGEER